MARKRKTSDLEDLMDCVSLLPWWAGVTIGVVGYLVLHWMASPVQVTSVRPDQIGSIFTQTFLTVIAAVGQYLVPVVGFGGAAISWFRRKKRSALIKDVTESNCASALDGMTWREFEVLVGEAYRMQGYHVTETGGGGADGGIDLELKREKETVLVQCKQWKAYKVGVDVVRELYGLMAAKGASEGIVVTSGRFTDGANAFAEGRNIRLVDGSALLTMVTRANRSIQESEQKVFSKTYETDPTLAMPPACPSCGLPMIKRIARKGPNAGGLFWGCSNFPTCRSVRQIAPPDLLL